MPPARKRKTEATVINSFPSPIMVQPESPQVSHYSLPQWSKAFALLAGIFFVICILWSALITDPALQRLHMDLLRISLPGFSGMDAMSIIIDLIESIVSGLIVGAAIASSLNIFAQK